MTRVGLAGAGPWATRFHAPMLAAATRLELTTVWARRGEAADELASRFGAEPVGTFEELVDRCDAVAFAVPPNVQAALAIQAAQAGRHLLLEKPLATTLKDSERLAAAVDRAGVVTQLVLTLRYQPEVRAALEGVEPARVRYVRASYLGSGALPSSPFATPWRQHDPQAGLLDVGPHTVDLAQAVAGPVVELRAATRDGVTTVSTVHRSGALGQLVLSILVPDGPGGVDLGWVTDSGYASLPSGTADETAVWRTISDEFAASIERGEPHPLDLRHGLRLQRVLDAVARSVATGRSVRPAD
ncbi:MAG TPA: Gfo/Idh/MocA family oxidoreductase [Lapillicoccus sp.]